MTSNGVMLDKRWIGNDFEENGNGLKIPVKDWRTPKKSYPEFLAFVPKFETSASKIQGWNITAVPSSSETVYFRAPRYVPESMD
jgi:hypothetical protein